MSGIGTCLVDTKHKVVLDIGYCSAESVKYRDVLITHAHVDHLAGAVSHAATRDLRQLTPSRFICSPEVGEPLQKLLSLWNGLQGAFAFEVVYLTPGSSVSLTPTLFVRAFPTFHRLPSQGYILYETRKKLKPEFVGRQGTELGALRKQGVVLEDVIETPVLAYTGDTLPEALAHPEVQKAEVLIAECTFLGPSVSVEEARRRGHTHLDELRPYVKGRTYENLYLFHFSDRYTEEYIWETINAGHEEDERSPASSLTSSDGPVDWNRGKFWGG